jgi:hypothetical protein
MDIHPVCASADRGKLLTDFTVRIYDARTAVSTKISLRFPAAVRLEIFLFSRLN